MAYNALFRRVAFDERIAARYRSQGKPMSMGSKIRLLYALTLQEYAALAPIATDWYAKFEAINAEARPLVAQGLTTASSPDLNNLLQERFQVTRDHIAQLQTALGGPARLAALEALIMKPSPSGPIFPPQ